LDDNYYPELSALSTGLAGKCPRCGQGRLFGGYLTVNRSCASCGLSFAFADAGDGAAWFVMLFVCIVGVGAILGVEAVYAPAFWVHVLLAIPILIILPLLLLRPVKGVMLNQQWKTSASPGRLDQ
jgi:uncharacterized protein (DUF983 family)